MNSFVDPVILSSDPLPCPAAEPHSEVLNGGGLPPSPIAGPVDIAGTIVPVCLGCGERRSSFEATSPPINPNPIRRKTYWKFKSDP